MSYKNRLRVGLFINLAQQMSGCTALAGLSPGIIGLVTSDYETKRCLIFGTYLFLFFVATLGVGFNRKLARKNILLVVSSFVLYFNFVLQESATSQTHLHKTKHFNSFILC